MCVIIRLMKTAALILNGTYIPPKIDGGYVLCADGGFNLLQTIGGKCDAVLGDCDSINDLPSNIKLIPYPKAKNETDGYLAVLYLLSEGYKRINIYGALGGRADMAMGNIELLAVARHLGIEAVIYDKGTEIRFISSGETLCLKCKKGDTISVLPYTDSIAFIHSNGLAYPLDGLTIERLSSRGMSNAATEESVTMEVKTGKAFVYITSQ